MEELWPHPRVDTAPVVRRAGGGTTAPTRRQRAVLESADGVRTPADIARRLGRPAFHVLIDVRRPAAAGHIETPPAPEPPRPSRASDRNPEAFAGPDADPDVVLLRRIRGALEARL
ncbi:hypothetical protein GCM10010405_31320 [Streptomyces macrosporus]|uniref:Uncharacterized protein n=1 Tax=Streptomyces macrosporus TaxID=44032 RepID=A0ABP5X936_9ACTN